MAALSASTLKALCERWTTLDEERKAKQREVDALDRQQKEITGKLLKHVREHGGVRKACLVARMFRVAISVKAGVVRWKDAFLRRLGEEAAAEETNKARQEVVEYLTVERIG